MTANADSKHTYEGTFSLGQADLPRSFTKKKTRVVEGCGPVAVAMVLGYWQTDKKEGRLLVNNDTFRGQLLDCEDKVTKNVQLKIFSVSIKHSRRTRCPRATCRTRH